MAITQSSVNRQPVMVVNKSVATDMSVEDFKDWLKRFDVDRDGRISRNELRAAIRTVGGRLSRWKSKQGLKNADSDGNGYIDIGDMDEVEHLISFARTTLGMNIATY